MRIEDYQALAMRTSAEGHDRVLNGCMGLIGESGEIVDLVKKWKFQSGDHADLPKDKLIEECGDVLWYCAELTTGLNRDLAFIFSEHYDLFEEMEEFNKNAPLEITVIRLAAIAARPAIYAFDGGIPAKYSEMDKTVLEAHILGEIIGIMSMIRDILWYHCQVTIYEAMERNIDKLRKRYPDGFDPERSIHREQ